MDNSIDTRLMEMQERLRAAELNGNLTLAPPGTNEPNTPRRLNGGRVHTRPKALGDIGTPNRTRRQLDLPVSIMQQPKLIDSAEIESKMKDIMKMNGILNINNRRYQTEMRDLEHLGELGNGTCGQVVKMLHKSSQTVIAVKQMRRSGNSEENKRIIMDLDVVLKSHDCNFIVRCLGCFITESDVWICMELMATCFDRLLKRLRVSVPEHICGKITLSTVRALHYLKENHGVIHRDVKPSNILLDEKGNIKLCDFGISGRLVDSKARTKNAGCAAYMAPERIEPPDPRKPDYDIRADVWSLGITLVELATGDFPYKDCKCDFEVLSRVLNDEPPSLPNDPARFSPEFQNFASLCLTKDYLHRPKYRKLLEHPFLRRYENLYVDVAEWYRKVIETSGVSSPALSVKNKSGLNGRAPVSLSSPQPFRRRLNTPDLNTHVYYRSASVSPNRYYVPSNEKLAEDSQIHSNAKQKITNYIKHHLGVGGTSNTTPPSPPPRLSRKLDSPRIFRRVSEMSQNQHASHSNQSPYVSQYSSNYPNQFNNYSSQSSSNQYPQSSSNNFSQSNSYHPSNPFVQYPPSNPFSTNPFNQSSQYSQGQTFSSIQQSQGHYSPSLGRRHTEASPCLPRRYVSPSPPMPPPRRLSECNSLPGSPHLRAKYSYTPEPTRRTLNLDL